MVVMLIPVSGVVPINGLIYEHWLYVPMVGFSLLLYGTARIFKFQIPNSKQYQNINSQIQNTCLIGVLFVCVALTIRQNWIWGDKIRFYEYTVGYGETLRIYNNLGMAYSEQGLQNEAILSYVKAVGLGDSLPQPHHNLAEVYRSQQKLDRAEQEYLRAIQIDNRFFYSYPPLVNIYLSRQEFEKALILLDEMSKMHPNDTEIMRAKAESLAGLGRAREAEEWLARARALEGLRNIKSK
jgi:tetratricopeptide (TPR) repeat protein